MIKIDENSALLGAGCTLFAIWLGVLAQPVLASILRAAQPRADADMFGVPGTYRIGGGARTEANP